MKGWLDNVVGCVLGIDCRGSRSGLFATYISNFAYKVSLRQKSDGIPELVYKLCGNHPSNKENNSIPKKLYFTL